MKKCEKSLIKANSILNTSEQPQIKFLSEGKNKELKM
jgi:hypothetical protein